MSSEHEDDELVRETVEAARQHYLNDFPNPDRTGCPPFDSLRRVAESSELPDRGVREHLMTCSPCFREFQELRAARSHPASQIVHDQPVGFRSVINPYYLVAALAVLFLGFAFVMLAYCDSRGILVIDDVNSNKAVIPASTDRLRIPANTPLPSQPEPAAPESASPSPDRKGRENPTPSRRRWRVT